MEGMYEFVGRFIGYSLWRGIRIDAVFIPLMFRMMKDSESRATFEDLKDVDFNLYSNLQTMLNCEPSLVEETFCQSFCIDTEFLGMRKTYDLCPDGASIPVTGDNVLSFLDLYVQHVLYIFSRRAIDSFLVGFHSLIPEKKLQDFSPQELEAVLCGQPTISDEDVEELRVASHCSLDENGAPHKQVLWFWSILARFSQEERSLVLQFVTGNERPPLTGFQALEHPFTVQLGSHMKPTDLPEAHVCFNQLVLPPAGSEEILREKLRIAVREGREGFELY
ncbi:hypothetical protein GUITHDRAFT_86719 [Guillardia theta CCMP2712]|uniref:HECT-type E3 ubiquitin transferase n=1 Tax=Guillardia theta (strain CCMP2712) TaxID=905079 RepID=L1JEG1_GUITC|nr:hypothetical protein GUITHDRAFT_86719 [Guillardia theta CCMP2712]EKX46500.1 hypothetical protein GUITHDRAFT_86719 [Guillardia theta CCMP2712]|eukprot:XP_005833480.1 hypothetical protein GUITHDRAFT_86719 [Guillardia theta CCMP2712]